jgi:hypothetical protein
MKTNDITKARNPALRGSLNALQRAALAARKTAIQTNTGIVIQREGKLVRIPAAELRESAVLREESTDSAD